MWMKRITALAVAAALAFAPALADQSNLFSPTTGTVSGLNLTNNYNSALNALASCNSGSSAPSNTLSGSPVAGQCWLNTSGYPYKLEVYDGASWEITAYIDAVNHWYEPVIGGGDYGTLVSAATVDLGTSPASLINITGTTSISSFGSTAPVGSIKFISFSGSLTIVNNSNTFLPTGSNINTSPGDRAIAVEILPGEWDILYFPYSGQPLALPTGLVTPFSITGGLPTSIGGTNTTAAITISGLTAADQTDAAYIGWTGSKSWAVSNGNAANGYAGGTSLPTSSTIHMYDCHGTSGDASFASLLAPTTAGGTFTASSCPTGYTQYARRIFSFTTNGSGAPNAYSAAEVAGGGFQSFYATASIIADINAATSTTTRTLYPMNVPTGIQVQWQGRILVGASLAWTFSSPSDADIAPSGSGTGVGDYSVYSMGMGRSIITNTSGQIGVRCSGSYAFTVSTVGFIDSRRN